MEVSPPRIKSGLVKVLDVMEAPRWKLRRLLDLIDL